MPGCPRVARMGVTGGCRGWEGVGMLLLGLGSGAGNGGRDQGLVQNRGSVLGPGDWD